MEPSNVTCNVNSSGKIVCIPEKQATVRQDAPVLFAKKYNQLIRPDAPWSREASEFYDDLKKLAGKNLKIKRQYGKRVVLEYPDDMVYDLQENGRVIGQVNAIDMDKDLVEGI